VRICVVLGLWCTGVSLAHAAPRSLPLPPPPVGTQVRPSRPDATVEAKSDSGTEASPRERPKLVVSDLYAQGVPAEQAAAFTDAVVQTLAERRLFRVLSRKDVQEILTAERQRQILGGCTAEEDCAANLGEALGARFVLSGSLAQVGSAYQLSLQTLDTVKGQPVGRSTRLARDLTTLRLLLPYTVAEATGSPLPPPASRVLQYAFIGTGAGAFLVGSFIGLQALSRQSVLNDELCPGGTSGEDCAGVSLRPRSYYQEQDRALSAQKLSALLLMVGGAGLAGAGFYLMPPPEGGPRVALVPTAGGIGLAGVFP
jgi:TolB-like protein